MNGKAFLIVGGTGAGKSTISRKMVLKFPENNRFIYDINNEYSDIYKKPLIDFKTFAGNTIRLNNACILFEEATIFLDNKISNSFIRELLVRKRWTKNTIILNFHSFRSIPKYIFNLCNYVIILKTNDSENFVDKTFDNDELTKAFNIVKNKDWLKTPSGLKYSPHLLFDIYAAN